VVLNIMTFLFYLIKAQKKQVLGRSGSLTPSPRTQGLSTLDSAFPVACFTFLISCLKVTERLLGM
jgi:hypothetical protein